LCLPNETRPSQWGNHKGTPYNPTPTPSRLTSFPSVRMKREDLSASLRDDMGVPTLSSSERLGTET